MRKKNNEFYRQILDFVDEKPRTALEIAKLAKTSWESTKNALNLLSQLKNIFSKIEGQRTLYFINPAHKKYNTLFNLPVSNTVKSQVYNYYAYIKEKWVKKTNNNPSKTQIIKVLAQINTKFKDLKLPFVWYLYGQVCIVPYLIEKEYKKTSNFYIPKEIEDEIIKKIVEYKDLSSVNLKKKHYKDSRNNSYIIKEEILDIILSKKSLNNERLLQHLDSLIENLSNDKINEKTRIYIRNYSRWLDSLKIRNLTEKKRNEIAENFCELWKLIALEYCKNSIKENYEKEIINTCFNNKIETQREEVNLLLSQ